MANLLNMHLLICVFMCMGVIFVCLSGLLRQGTSLCELLNKLSHEPAFVSGPGTLVKLLWVTQTWSNLM